jgi:hypothetical protein
MMTKIAISITPELDAALNLAALELGLPKSRLIETYLRENPALARFIAEVRSEPPGKPLAIPRKAVKRAS